MRKRVPNTQNPKPERSITDFHAAYNNTAIAKLEPFQLLPDWCKSNAATNPNALSAIVYKLNSAAKLKHPRHPVPSIS
jgi:hypothetical protein